MKSDVSRPFPPSSPLPFTSPAFLPSISFRASHPQQNHPSPLTIPRPSCARLQQPPCPYIYRRPFSRYHCPLRTHIGLLTVDTLFFRNA